MSAPTKGPWRCARNTPNGYKWLIGTKEAVVATTPSDNKNSEANAHLLAASWSMREAITEHLDDLDNGRPINTAKLYAALAAARGEGR